MATRNLVDSPVEVGSFSHYTSQVVGLGISSINRMGDFVFRQSGGCLNVPSFLCKELLLFFLKQARVKRSLQVLELIFSQILPKPPPGRTSPK